MLGMLSIFIAGCNFGGEECSARGHIRCSEGVELKKCKNSQQRPDVEAQAVDFCDKIDTLIKEKKMPRVLISSDQL